jgi:hypothetical protein
VIARSAFGAPPGRGEEGISTKVGLGVTWLLSAPPRSKAFGFSATPSCLFAASPRQVSAHAACGSKTRHGVAPHLLQSAHFSAIASAIAVRGPISAPTGRVKMD